MQLEQFLLFLKRHAEVFEEGEAFFFGFGGGNYGNGEAKNIFMPAIGITATIGPELGNPACRNMIFLKCVMARVIPY